MKTVVRLHFPIGKQTEQHDTAEGHHSANPSSRIRSGGRNKRKQIVNNCAVVTNRSRRAGGAPFPLRSRLLRSRWSRLKGRKCGGRASLGLWLRRSATSFIPVLPTPETLRFFRQHSNRSDRHQPKIDRHAGESESRIH